MKSGLASCLALAIAGVRSNARSEKLNGASTITGAYSPGILATATEWPRSRAISSVIRVTISLMRLIDSTDSERQCELLRLEERAHCRGPEPDARRRRKYPVAASL